MRIAFYAPLKSPDHPVVSGDRQMARLIVRALEEAGHEVKLASRMRVFLLSGEDFEENDLRAEAEDEQKRILADWGQAGSITPDLWLTYHPYYKSPDWIGPAIAKELNIHYATIEASYAGKRENGPWGAAQDDVRDGLRQAVVNFYMTDRDREGLAVACGGERRLVHLPPFTDLADFPERQSRGGGPARLFTAAMMRRDVKLESYRFLANALEHVKGDDWVLDIAGSGAAEDEVRDAFSDFSPECVFWRGALSEEGLRRALASADVFLWPGIGEAYGMVYLEAQGCALPVIAQETAGVPSVVRDDVGGLLTEEGDVAAYGRAIERLITDESLRARLGEGAKDYVFANHGLEMAAQRLDMALRKACEGWGAQ
ncbi:MAG: glycosyltransferase family 4 protein [Hyphomicrobiales bacterium]